MPHWHQPVARQHRVVGLVAVARRGRSIAALTGLSRNGAAGVIASAYACWAWARIGALPDQTPTRARTAPIWSAASSPSATAILIARNSNSASETA